MKLKSILSTLGLAGALTLNSPSQELARGLRNNNPGNIVKSSIEWKGVVGSDGRFLQFKTPEDGIRAMARILRTYNTKYNLTNVTQIINRWAPPSENATKKYINFVCKEISATPTQKLDLNNNDVMADLISAIIKFENGSNPYSKDTIIKGIKKA